MLFAIIATDRPGQLELRLANRAAHLQFLADLGDKLKAAGPFHGDDGKPNGSLIILDAADRAAAEATAAVDPYAIAGLFERVDIRQWTWGVKNPDK